MRTEDRAAAIPWRVFKRALKLLWQELFLLGLAGYAWMLLGLFVIPLAPMTVGLFYVANQVAHGNAIGMTTVFTGAWRFLSRSLIWGALNLIVGLLIWADLGYYQGVSGNAGSALVTLAILLALAWTVIQIFALAYLAEAGPVHLKEAFKQSFVLVISQPLFVVGLLIVIAGLALICWYLPILIGYAVTGLALIANVAVITLIEQRSRSERSSQTFNRTPR
jgi:uncharacterized membrane protein YesL